LQKNCCPGEIDFHFLDQTNYNHISEKISETFGVPHQCPQILVINEGHCIFHESHSEISLESIMGHAMGNGVRYSSINFWVIHHRSVMGLYLGTNNFITIQATK